MRTLLSRLVMGFVGMFALFGISRASASLPPDMLAKLTEIKKTTPLYLQLGIDQLPNRETDLRLSQHWQHWSHNSHGSHYAHYSHRSHYSHYNYYR